VTVASWRQNLVLQDKVRGIRLEPSFALRLEQAAKAGRR
jgi:hypothetical protein